MIVLNSIIPLYSLILLLLVISGNYIGEVLPCRFRKLMSSNMVLKYICTFLTLIFFVVLSSNHEQKLSQVFYNSIIIFVWFMILAKNNIHFFLGNCLLFFVIYVFYLLKIQYINENVNGSNDKKIRNMEIVNNVLIVSAFLSTCFGFILYLGEKKVEYNSKFKYRYFIFGKPDCAKEKTKYISFSDALKRSFSRV